MWSPWDACPELCPGKQKHHYRTRDCMNPTPRGGGKPCKGLDKEKKICPCSLDDGKFPYLQLLSM